MSQLGASAPAQAPTPAPAAPTPGLRLIRVAARLLPAGQAEWGRAMQAELASLGSGPERFWFALGCLRAGLRQVPPVRAVGYALAELLVMALAVLEGLHGALLIEVIGLILVVPALLWWVVTGTGSIGPAKPQRWARTARRGGYTLLAACALAWAAFLAADVAQPSHIIVSDLLRPDGAGVPALAEGLLVAVLLGYLGALLALTSARSRFTGRPVTAIACLGGCSGLVLAGLLPAGQSLAVSGGLLAIGYGVALAACLLGVPILAGVLTVRWSTARDGFDLASSAGGLTAAVAAVVQCAAGVTVVRVHPAVVDSHLVDKGTNWLAPGMIEMAVGYLLLLVLMPLIGLALGWSGAALVRLAARTGSSLPGPPTWTRTSVGTLYGAVTLVALVTLAHPIAQVFAATDHSGFGGVGTTSVAFGPGMRQLLTTNGAQVAQLWNVSDPGRRPTLLASYQGQALFTPDLRTMATAGAIWRVSDSATAEPTAPVRVGRFTGGQPEAISPDGQLLATSTVVKGQGTIIWNIADRAHPRLVGSMPDAEWTVVSKDDQTLVTSNDYLTTIWQVAADRSSLTKQITLHAGGSPALSPDGRFLITHSGDVQDTQAVLWRLTPGAGLPPQRVTTLPVDTYGDLQFSPDGRWLFSAVADGSLRLWNAADLAHPFSITPADPRLAVYQIGISSTLTTPAFSPDGHTLAVVWGNSIVARWTLDGPGGKPVQTSVVRRQTRGSGQVAFSPDLSMVGGSATDGSNSVSLWRLGSGIGGGSSGSGIGSTSGASTTGSTSGHSTSGDSTPARVPR